MGKKPTLPKQENSFDSVRSTAIQQIAQSEFPPEIKKEFGQKLKQTKNIEELGKVMNGLINFIAEKLKLKSQSKSPREEAKAITDGEIENKHIGVHTLETFTQEMISLCQTKPMFRSSKWKKRCARLKQRLRDSEIDKAKTRPLLWEMERIEAMR